MPLPNPKKGENQEDFVSRCMGDEVMNKEFPDQKQRSAVCYSRFKKSDSKEIKEDFDIKFE